MERQGVHWGRRWAGLSGAAHTKAAHSQQQRGQARMSPPSSFRWPDSAQQPPGTNTIHNAPSHWTTRNAEEREGGRRGPVSQCCMAVSHSTTADNMLQGILTFSWLPHTASWVSLCPPNAVNLENRTGRKEMKGPLGHRGLHHTQICRKGLQEQLNING